MYTHEYLPVWFISSILKGGRGAIGRLSEAQSSCQLACEHLNPRPINLANVFLCLEIKYVSGSVEAACGLGLADAVVDLVETGTTMKVCSNHKQCNA